MRIPHLLLFLLVSTLNATAQICDVYFLEGHGHDRLSGVAAGSEQDMFVVWERSQAPGTVVLAHLDAEGEVAWKRALRANDPAAHLTTPRVLHRPGGVVVYGVVNHMGVSGTSTIDYVNYFAIALDNAGELEWARYYMMASSPLELYGHTVRCAIGPDGGLYLVTGASSGLYVSRTAPDGSLVWTRNLPQPEEPDHWTEPYIRGLAVDGQGGLIIAAERDGHPLLLRVSGTGELLSGSTMTEFGQCSAVSAMDDGGMMVLAMFQTEITGDLISAVVRMDADGAVEWARRVPVGFGKVVQPTAAGGAVVGVGTEDGNHPFAQVDMGSATTRSMTPSMGELDIVWPDRTEEDAFIMGMYGGMSQSIVRLGGFDDLSCAFVEHAHPHTVVDAVPFQPLAGLVESTSKTWTMAMGGMEWVDSTDVRVDLGSGPARPGFEYRLTGLSMSIGAVEVGAMALVMEVPDALTFVSADPAPINVSGNEITWGFYGPFAYAERAVVTATFVIPPTTELGSSLTSTLSVAYPGSEVELSYRSTSWTQVVTGSYDPNDKLVRPESMYHFENDSILDYTIRFQNTGTDTAFTVVIVDTLAAELDVTTFRAGASSHPYTYSLTGGGLLTFTFANILLPDSNVNEPLSHGLVKFTIKPYPDAVEMGHAFVNRGYIYFDFNEPIITPDAITVVGLPMDIPAVGATMGPQLYPVPVRDELTAVLPGGDQVFAVQVFTAEGRRVAVQPRPQGDRMAVPVAHLPAGLYLLQLMDRKGGIHMARFVKD